MLSGTPPCPLSVMELPNASSYWFGSKIEPAWLTQRTSIGKTISTVFANKREFAPSDFNDSCAPEVLHIVASERRRNTFAQPKLEATPAPPVSSDWTVTVEGWWKSVILVVIFYILRENYLPEEKRMSHNIFTGLWKKRKWNHKNLFKFLHEMTPAQISFCREVVNQNLGQAPSKYWGSTKIKIKLPQSKESLRYFLEATEHPRHIMSEKLSKHKEGGSVVGAIGEALVSGGKAVGKVVVSGAKWAASHASQIMKGVGTALQLGATGVQLAASVGLLDPDSDATLIGLANATQQIADTYHSEKAEKEAAAKTKKGEGLHEFNKWAGETGDRLVDWAEKQQHEPKSFKPKPMSAFEFAKYQQKGGQFRARIHLRSHRRR